MAKFLGPRAYHSYDDVLDEKMISAIGVATRILFIFAFVALFVYIAIANLQQQFIALTYSAGACAPVPSVITQVANADNSGNWDSSPDFAYAKSIYTFTFTNFEMIPKDYIVFMNNQVQGTLRQLGALMAQQDFGDNLIVWNSWTTYFSIPATDATQKLYLTGDTQDIFEKQNIFGTLSTEEFDWPVIGFSTTAWDKANAVYSLAFSVQQLMSGSGQQSAAGQYFSSMKMNASVNPAIPGFDSSLSGATVTLTAPLRTITTALAINYNIQGPSTVDQYDLMGEYTRGFYMGVEYKVIAVFDNYFEHMIPAFCIRRVDEADSTANCVIQMSAYTFGIPFLSHTGSNPFYPVKCECSTAAGLSPICDSFNFTVGLRFFDYAKNMSAAQQYPKSWRPFLPALEYFYGRQQGSRQGSHAQFVPSWAAVWGQRDSHFKDKTWRSAAYRPGASISYGSGALLTFSVSSATDYSKLQ